MSTSLNSRRDKPTATPPPQRTALGQRLAELRGPRVTARPLDARALAALAANPGCRRRALLDGAGVDKSALATALGSPATFGQSYFAHQRGNVFEARVTADGGEQLVALLRERVTDPGPPPPPGAVDAPELTADGPDGRTARTRIALAEATAAGRWAVLRHPMVSVSVAGSPAYLEPDAVVVHPDGSWTVVEIKSFPMLDGTADPTKVGAAARQAAVYVLALRELAGVIGAVGSTGAVGSAGAADSGGVAGSARGAGADGAGAASPDPGPDADAGPDAGGAAGPAGGGGAAGAGASVLGGTGLNGPQDGTVDAAGLVRQRVLLVCPKDFSNLPTAELIDVRKQLAVTGRQLARLTRIEEIAAALPAGATFDLMLADDGKTPTRPLAELSATVDAVPAAYVPDCLASCELAFHCRHQARAAGAVETLGRGVRGELGGLTTMAAVLAAAHGPGAERAAGAAETGAAEAGAGAGPAPARASDPAGAPGVADPGALATASGDAADPAVLALRRAAALRAEALAEAAAARADATACGPGTGSAERGEEG
ncbi:hypothetical protein ACMA1D_14090 [Streptomyces sp. 796.1]|uniref:hypothetical protein n=1 Tax=Streptomyces sp. 796.1 TaxID=3163029 RepID=UPI0039C978F5